MSNFRKTLPLPPPGRTVDEAIENSLRPPPRKTPSAADRRSMSPRPGRLSSSSNNDLKRSKPGGRKSLPPPRAPGQPDAPPAATDWTTRAHALAEALDEALRSGSTSPKMQAAVERAHAAWNLDGVSQRHLAHVAHVSRRAYDAIRGTSRSGLDAAYLDCARVLHLGLPSAMRRRVSMEVVVEAVRAMRHEADRSVAVTQATMTLFGWIEANRLRATEAIRLALQEHPPDTDDV